MVKKDRKSGKKCEDDHLKTKGGASQGKRFHLVTLGPPRQGEGQTRIIILCFSAVTLQPPASSHTTCYIYTMPHAIYIIPRDTII